MKPSVSKITEGYRRPKTEGYSRRSPTPKSDMINLDLIIALLIFVREKKHLARQRVLFFIETYQDGVHEGETTPRLSM